MANKDWNPELYLKYHNERTQPSIDLISRINFSNPRNIIDIGCGPGNSTQILVDRWPKSKIVGIDNSPAMIQKAKNDFPEQEWKIMDANNIDIDEQFDIVFSNATIQWLPNHEILLKKLKKLVSEQGLLAVQLPLFWDMPLGKSISQISRNEHWKTFTSEVSELFTIHNSSFYYDQLSKLFSSVEIWETDYIHILDSQLSILAMIRSTGLKPFLEKLENDYDKISFESEVFNTIRKEYPFQKNGKVLFPFKRLFFIAGN
ncbi:MAG: methyltransferase domain-containing protein [Ignavibacteriaceae bacterium]|nr:methyltransferase domain-containing protein [Ignavibacteriaceae bacterium]